MEGGSSTWDFSGELEEKSRNAELNNLDFKHFYENYLYKYDNVITYRTSSPRIFECAASGSVILAVRGRYDNLLIENENCIMINEDFTDLEEKISILQDNEFCDFLAKNAKTDLIENPNNSYKVLSNKIVEIIVNSDCQKLNTNLSITDRNKVILEKSAWIIDTRYVDKIRNERNLIKRYMYLRNKSKHMLMIRLLATYLAPNQMRKLHFILSLHAPYISNKLKSYLK